MRMQADENAIRVRAYQIWEEDGCRDGHHEEHWRRAEAECGGTASGGANPLGEGDPAATASDADVRGGTPSAEPGSKLHRVPARIGET